MLSEQNNPVGGGAVNENENERVRVFWRTLTVPVEAQLYEAIERSARAEERQKGAQVRVLLKDALTQRGFWPLLGNPAQPTKEARQ